MLRIKAKRHTGSFNLSALAFHLNNEGIIRNYKIKENGDEATLFIRWEEQFIASHDTINNHEASRFIYCALEPTILLEIDYDQRSDFKDTSRIRATAQFLFNADAGRIVKNHGSFRYPVARRSIAN